MAAQARAPHRPYDGYPRQCGQAVLVRLQRCLDHAQSQRDKPDITFTGGDMIMDDLDGDAMQVKAQWGIFNGVKKQNTEIPVEHCLVNHDVWDWGNRSAYRHGS